jgi:cell division septation protein DedD
MPSREPDSYKDKIEVSLDSRQIFYMFFGGAVIVGLVFVLGVMVGRRVEARGHVDRAQTGTAVDPLAALDRLEAGSGLSFQGALTGGDTTSEVEKTIGEIEKARAQAGGDKPTAPAVADKPVAADKHVVAADAEEPKADKAVKSEKLTDKDKDHSDKADHGDKPEHGDKADHGDKDHGDKKKPKTADSSDKPAKDHGDHGDHADADKPAKDHGDHGDHASDDASASAKSRFTLQLSSFQDKGEAEAFLGSIKSSGYEAYLTSGEVDGKGTWYRVRVGSYRTLDAANDAKASFEKNQKKSALVTRL